MMSSVAKQMGKRVLRSHCRPPADEETLERLIAATRRAADDPTVLPVCVGEVSAALGGAAVLLTLRPPHHDPGSVVAIGIAETFVRSYAETYYLHDPWVQRLANRAPGVGFGYELVPRWQLLHTIFYREWMAPQDLLPDLSIAGLLLKGDSQPFSMFAAFRRRGTRLFKLDDLTLLRRVLPDLQQAVRRTRAPSPGLY